MQKFKTMAKLKLKTVQNGTEGEMANLMDSGSYDYVDCSGYVIIGSGLYDNSGHVVEEGQLIIDAGHDELRVGSLPCFQIDVSWDSGVIDLPLGGEVGAMGYQPYVTVTFDNPILLAGKREKVNKAWHLFETLVGSPVVTQEWGTPLLAHFEFDYTLICEHNHTIGGREFGTFHIPYRYEPPQNNNEE